MKKAKKSKKPAKNFEEYVSVCVFYSAVNSDVSKYVLQTIVNYYVCDVFQNNFYRVFLYVV